MVAVVALAGFAGAGTHTVRPGETASSIASAHGTTVSALAAANHLKDPDVVVLGTTLVIPGAAGGPAAPAPAASTYTVKPGDTLARIATKTGTSVGALAKANGLANPHRILIGLRLQIPAGAASSGPASTANLPARLLAHPERLALRPTFEQWAGRYGVPADLLEALCWMESGWQNSVVSSTGAVGIGQLMPDTVSLARSSLGQGLDPADPSANIRMSAWFLGHLLKQTNGDVALSVAAYYQGLRSVRTRPLYDDTKQYVSVVLALRPRFA